MKRPRTRARVDPGPTPLTVAEMKLAAADAHLAAIRTESMLTRQSNLEKMWAELSERTTRRFNAIEETQGDAAEYAWITLALLVVLIVAVPLFLRHAAANA